MRTFHFGTNIVNVDQIVKIERTLQNDNSWRLSIYLSEGTVESIYYEDEQKVTQMATLLAAKFSDPDIHEIHLDALIEDDASSHQLKTTIQEAATGHILPNTED